MQNKEENNKKYVKVKFKNQNNSNNKINFTIQSLLITKNRNNQGQRRQKVNFQTATS